MDRLIESTHVCSTSTGELVGPPITGAIYGATNNWHCVIAFSGTVQVVGAITLLYGTLTSLPPPKLILTTARRSAQRGSRENRHCLKCTRSGKVVFRLWVHNCESIDRPRICRYVVGYRPLKIRVVDNNEWDVKQVGSQRRSTRRTRRYELL